MKIAIPTNNPGGLEASRSDHFGHCDTFTIVSLSPENVIVEVETLPNAEHHGGGCMVPVQLLDDAGVQAIVVGGMGARPMQGFTGAGIEVFFAGSETVQDAGTAIEMFVAGKLPRMNPGQVCQGSGNCQH